MSSLAFSYKKRTIGVAGTDQNAKALGGSHALDNRCNSARAVAPRNSRRNRRKPRSPTARSVRGGPALQSAERSSWRSVVESCTLQLGRARGGPHLRSRYQCPTNQEYFQECLDGSSIDSSVSAGIL